MSVIPPKLNCDRIFKLRDYVKNVLKAGAPNALASNIFRCLVNKFKSLIVAHLITSNNGNWPQILSIINFLIDLIPNIIVALLNEQYFVAFL